MKVNTLFGVLALLATARTASAATYICGATATPAAADVCTCPTGTGVIATTPITALSPTAAASVTGLSITPATASGVTTLTLATYTGTGLTTANLLSVCTDLNPGYQIAAAAAAAAVTFPAAASMVAGSATAVTSCPANSYCPGSAGKIVFTPTTNLAQPTSWAFTANAATACPLVSTLTGTSPAGSIAVTACLTPAGTYVNGFTINGNTPASPSTATITYCLANSYCPGSVAMSVQGAGSTTCPGPAPAGTGSSNIAAVDVATATAKSTVASCLIIVGYSVSTYTAASGSTPASATVAVCPANSYCPGYAVTGTNSVQATYVVSGAGVGAVACPFVTVQGDATSNSAATANIAITFCVLDPGYYQTAGAAATTTALATATVAVCPSNYYCPGSAAGALLPIVAGPVTNSNNGASACPKLTTLGDATYTPYPGTSSNAITDCYTMPGYSLTPAATPLGQLCLANTYCPGGFAVPAGTPAASIANTIGSDGAIGCPTSSTLSAAVVATAATANNGITDCLIPSGYYVSTLQGTPAMVVTNPVPGVITLCSAISAGLSCAGGLWSDVLGYGITSVLPNYVVQVVTGSVPTTVTACGGAAGTNTAGTSCSGSTGSNLLTIGYGGIVSMTDVYVSAPGAVATCPINSCTLGQSLTAPAIPSGSYLANGVATICPTGATCSGAPTANITSVAYGATTNAGYYVSTKATSGAVAVLTACPSTTATTCAGGQSLATLGGIVVNAGYYASGVTSPASVVAAAACPTGASCAGATGSNAFTPGYGATTVAGYWLSGFATATAAGSVSACGAGGGVANAADKCAPGVALTTLVAAATTGIAVPGAANPSVVAATYYQASGTSATTAVYALCPTGVTCAGGAAGTLYAGATAAAGYYVPAVGSVATCPTGAACLGGAVCTGAAAPFAACTGVGLPTVPLTTAGGIALAYPGYISTTVNNGNAIVISACPTGALCAGDTNTGNGGDLPYSGATSLPGYYVSAVGTVSACPAGATCTGGQALSAPGGGTIMAGFYVATAGTAPALCPSGSYCPGGGNLGLAGGSFACPANSTLTGCNDFADNTPSTVNSSPVSVAPAPVTVTPAPITVTPAPITVTTAPITVTPASQPISINVPAPVVSAASSRSSALVLVLAALAALAAF